MLVPSLIEDLENVLSQLKDEKFSQELEDNPSRLSGLFLPLFFKYQNSSSSTSSIIKPSSIRGKEKKNRVKKEVPLQEVGGNESERGNENKEGRRKIRKPLS